MTFVVTNSKIIPVNVSINNSNNLKLLLRKCQYDIQKKNKRFIKQFFCYFLFSSNNYFFKLK